MARLLEFFSPVFSFGLELDERIAAGTAANGADAVQAHARGLLDRAKAAALAAGKRPEHVDSASFAAVSWFDEIVTRNPAYWNSVTPLQVALFNTNNAGNEFFHHLSVLKSDEDEVREVYYHALLLGFVGQYYFENGDTGELGKLKELHGRQLPVAPAALHTLREEQITPQPYLVKDPPGPRYPKQWDKLLLKAGAVVALLIPLGYLLWLLVAAPKDTGPTVAQMVDGQLQTYACSELSANVAKDGTAAVAGFVSRPEDITRVQSDIGAIQGVKSPTFDVKVRIWPHCEVVALLKPYRARNMDDRRGLQVTPTTGHSDRFTEGERVTVKLVQADYDGYLYVDYYTVDGSVIHLYPNKREPESGRLIRSGEQFNVGEKIPEGWIVGPPFGQEMITVVSSPTPLYPAERPEYEPASTYLPRLRELLDASHGNEHLVANFLFLQTEPKR
jgi:type IV/VI secretion system ImpK/VasF family protein